MGFITSDFVDRREKLIEAVKTGLILLPANNCLPRNYKANPYSFRQDSTFLYYTGIKVPDVYLLMDCRSGNSYLCGEDASIEDTIWAGRQSTLAELAEKSGIKNILTSDQMQSLIQREKTGGFHFLPPYSDNRITRLASLLDIHPQEVRKKASLHLSKSVIKQRSVKSAKEIAEIESAIDISGKMHTKAMEMAIEGTYEYQIAAEMYRIAKASNLEFAYQVICTIHGEILHNETHNNKLKTGQLLLIDAGVESTNCYASDITRTTPVGRKFSQQQKEIYDIVLNAQEESIRMIKPGIRFADIHRNAANIITSGLQEIGLMKGENEEAVKNGAHALFFPHGLGHMMGLDVHDMEDLGEDLVGYNDEVLRSKQFGTAYLRMAKETEPGFVITVEPGIYFIPALINQWKEMGKFSEFINYNKLNKYLKFGGIRIEDNILVTHSGSKVLGKPIVKTIKEIENL